MASNTGIAFFDTNKIKVPSINLSEMQDLAGQETGAGIPEIIADNVRGADRRMKPYFENVFS